MEKVGLVINHNKPEAHALALQLTEWFRARQWEVVSDWDEIMEAQVKCLISLGGDGTLLATAREAAPLGLPVLGVNLGRLGFLCEIERDEIYRALEKVIRDDFQIQERLMLTATVKRAEREQLQMTVLNDVVFARDPDHGIITLQASLSGEPTVSYPADGLIVSTPTGSTAYSLSAGGPIVGPDVAAILITPLAAHSLSARPMVVSHQDQVEILLARGESCRVTFDGQQSMILSPGDTVIIHQSPLKALFIRLGTRSFPRVVREKLKDRWHD